MKSIIKLVFAIVLLFGAINFSWADGARDQLLHYMQSGDQQDVEGLEMVLHPEFVSTYTFKGDDAVKSMGRDKFISMFGSKKFGGSPRTFKLDSSFPSPNLTILKGQMTGEKLKFSGVFIMEKHNEEWKLKQEFLIVEPFSA